MKILELLPHTKDKFQVIKNVSELNETLRTIHRKILKNLDQGRHFEL